MEREQQNLLPKQLNDVAVVKQRQQNFYSFHIRVPLGILNSAQLNKLAEIATTYGQNTIFFLGPQTLELPWVGEDKIDIITEKLKQVGLNLSCLNSCFQGVIACPGKRWCRFGWIDSLSIAQKINDKFYGNQEYRKLPYKFEVGISGCINSCTRPQVADLGFCGQVQPQFIEELCLSCKLCGKICPTEAISYPRKKGKVSFDESKCIFCGDCIVSCPQGAWREKRVGLAIYIGGKWGRFPQLGKRIANFLNAAQVISAIYKALELYISQGKKRERFANLVNRLGLEQIKEKILSD